MAALIFLWLEPGGALAVWWLVPGWMALYGCALHAAGFFMPRGFKIIWLGIYRRRRACWAQCCALAGRPPFLMANWAMGVLFGGAHLAYGVYLYFTEQRGNAT